MAQFVIYCTDKPGSADLRAATRARHLDYLAAAGDALVMAGRYVDADGATLGSILIVACETEADARRFAENDPYAKAGLFSDVRINGWLKAALPN